MSIPQLEFSPPLSMEPGTASSALSADLPLPSQPYSTQPYAGVSSARTSYTHVGTACPTPARATTPVQASTEPETEQQLNADGTHSDAEAVSETRLVDSERCGNEQEIPPKLQTSITFLLVSGRRRTSSYEPETTVGRVKELVWQSWPTDWTEERPPAPYPYLRMLYQGKILEDEDTLSKLKFPTHLSSSPPSPATIVHLSIRPVAAADEDADTFKKKTRRRLGRSNTGGDSVGGSVDVEGDPSRGPCCCIIC